ncbi:hypothetical protein Tco_1123276 [Tanacetum coccineum]|uniref:Uncharacterized protein n=1 Tax=Tanacetum coccineum TaxID=301880 RepID=A0ABQ5J3Z3_9ASTR
MSDSKHSTVTYTSISSDDGSLDVGSLGVIVLGYDGLPMMPEDPYAYVKAVMQEPPPPNFVPEPIYSEFMPPEDDLLPAEEQPLPTAVPLLFYREDPTDYPTNKDDDKEEESSEDDTDDEEEEHQALADSVVRLLAISTPPSSPLTSYSSPLLQIPSPPLPVSSPLPMSPPLLPASPTRPLGYKAAMNWASMAMMRAAASSTYILAPRSETPPSGIPPLLHIPLPTSSPLLLLPTTDCRADVPEVTLPP